MRVSSLLALALSAGTAWGGLAAFGTGAAAAPTHVIDVMYGAPGEQTPSSVVVDNAKSFGTETFDRYGGGGLRTQFGSNGSLVGTYSSAMSPAGANVLGGAGGVGAYVEAIGGTAGYKVVISAIGNPGVNYFGLWASAFDFGSQITFRNSTGVVGSFIYSDLVAALGPCSQDNPYCGNPNDAYKGQNASEYYVYLNFVDMTGFFDEVDFINIRKTGNFESDNHAVGRCVDPAACASTAAIDVPEPVSLALLGLGVAGTVAVRRRRVA